MEGLASRRHSIIRPASFSTAPETCSLRIPWKIGFGRSSLENPGAKQQFSRSRGTELTASLVTAALRSTRQCGHPKPSPFRQREASTSRTRIIIEFGRSQQRLHLLASWEAEVSHSRLTSAPLLLSPKRSAWRLPSQTWRSRQTSRSIVQMRPRGCMSILRAARFRRLSKFQWTPLPFQSERTKARSGFRSQARRPQRCS